MKSYDEIAASVLRKSQERKRRKIAMIRRIAVISASSAAAALSAFVIWQADAPDSHFSFDSASDPIYTTSCIPLSRLKLQPFPLIQNSPVQRQQSPEKLHHTPL